MYHDKTFITYLLGKRGIKRPQLYSNRLLLGPSASLSRSSEVITRTVNIGYDFHLNFCFILISFRFFLSFVREACIVF